MTARIIDGRAVARTVVDQVRADVAAYVAAGGAAPGLAVVLVGDSAASQVYVSNKRKTTETVGMRSFAHDLPATASEAELLALVDRLNADPAVNAILVQLPLPKHIDPEHVIERIDPKKDVDGFHPYNIGRLVQKRPTLRPCTPFGCMRLLQETGEDLVGKHAVVIGQSNIVGRPMALELLMARCTVTICHSATRDLPGIVRQGDIVVAGVGRPKFVAGDWIKPGAIVIDVGINRLPDGKLCGDVDFDAGEECGGLDHPGAGRRGADDDRDAAGEYAARGAVAGATLSAVACGRSAPFVAPTFSLHRSGMDIAADHHGGALGAPNLGAINADSLLVGGGGVHSWRYGRPAGPGHFVGHGRLGRTRRREFRRYQPNALTAGCAPAAQMRDCVKDA